MPVPAAVADLPVVDVLADLGLALDLDLAAVLVAPPGAGKTTVVPLWLLDAPWLGDRSILMLEPRRLAARAAARRMAALLGERVGETVGYQTRDERQIGPSTRIEVVTEGILTRRLQHDPSLPGVAIVIFDEVHERNLPTDLGLALALDVRATIRPDLRLLAMSATPDTPRLATLLASTGGEAPVVSSDGRAHPVEIRSTPVLKGGRVEQAVADTVVRALREEHGDLLVFLPGIGEIRRVETLLRSSVTADVDIRPLAGALALAEQDRALQASEPGRRRVVLSTDIAESSLTVDGVRVVVDAGLARVPRFDPRTGMSRLTTVATSRASADQRAGRAGRTEPGVCYRLWSKIEHGSRRAHLPAEITQVDLAGLLLELAAWRARPQYLQFIDPPPPKALDAARELLVLLGALAERDPDSDGPDRLTRTGEAMLGVPVHPRLARMVVDAPERHRPLACVVAAIIDERDIMRGRIDELPADVALRVAIVCGSTRDDRADRRSIEHVRDRALDIARRAAVTLRFDAVDADRCGSVLALAYPDRVAVRRSQAGQFQLRTGGGAWTSKTDPIAEDAFIVAADLDGNRTNARVRLGAGLEADDVLVSLADQIERREQLVWDKMRNDLVLRVEARLGAMTISELLRPASPGPDTARALADRVTATQLAPLHMALAAGLRARVQYLRALFSDDGWPDWSDRALVRTVDTWLAPYLEHAIGAADLERLDVAMLLSNQLGWDEQTRLAELAPTTLTVASGRQHPIDYLRDAPTVSVRVQELYGTTEHPTITGGRTALTLELLSPADRPVQITRDLPGFWSGTWTDVRKDMAGRYPKHFWPADPATARPRRPGER